MLFTSNRVYNIECVPPDGKPYHVGTENYRDVAERRMYAIWGTESRKGYSYRVVDVTPKKRKARQ